MCGDTVSIVVWISGRAALFSGCSDYVRKYVLLKHEAQIRKKKEKKKKVKRQPRCPQVATTCHIR